MSIKLNPASELLTIPEVAELLSVSIPTIRRLQQQRQIAFHKVRGSVRFSRGDVAAYLDSRRVRQIDQ
jgi:excisionase family DNA binding protein